MILSSLISLKIRRHEFRLFHLMHLRIYFYLQEEPVVTLEEFMYKKTVDAPALFLKQPCWVKATL